MNSYPSGLHAKTNYFRVLKSVWTSECKQFVLSRMKASTGNIKCIMIVDDITLNITCEAPNADLTAFTPQTPDPIHKAKMKAYARIFVDRTIIQKSNKSVKQKETEIKKLEE